MIFENNPTDQELEAARSRELRKANDLAAAGFVPDPNKVDVMRRALRAERKASEAISEPLAKEL